MKITAELLEERCPMLWDVLQSQMNVYEALTYRKIGDAILEELNDICEVKADEKGEGDSAA